MLEQLRSARARRVSRTVLRKSLVGLEAKRRGAQPVVVRHVGAGAAELRPRASLGSLGKEAAGGRAPRQHSVPGRTELSDRLLLSPREGCNVPRISLARVSRPSLAPGFAPSTRAFGAADVSGLLTDLLASGSLSSSPLPPPWPQEQPGRSDLEAVRSWLQGAVGLEVRSVFRVHCTAAAAEAYAGVRRTLGPERLLWHGTPWDAVGNIAHHGFNRAYCGRHGAKLGRGTYFAEDASYAMRFCGRSSPRAVFLAGVLPGRYCRGEDGLVEPPPADSRGARFDSTVDDPERPRAFCVFRDFQALPLYLVETA